MTAPTLKQARPTPERLETRGLMTTGVSAGVSHGVLSIMGTSTSTPIVVDVRAIATRFGPYGYVVVEGVGIYPAAMVKRVAITRDGPEPVIVNRGPNWNPTFRLTTTVPTPTPVPIVTPVPAPVATPAPVTPPTTVTSPTPVPTVITAVETAEEQAIVDAVNAVRAQNGLAPLTVNPRLVEAAHIQSDSMAQLQTMSHNLPNAPLPGLLDRANYVGYQFTTLGENIAYNYPDVTSVMAAWMNSSGHRANILDPSYTQIGVGIATDSTGAPYYTQEFGQPA